MKNRLIKTAMESARRIAKFSNCLDKKVGCILLDKTYMPVVGENNVACTTASSGICFKKGKGYCPAVHAEVHALNVLPEDAEPYIAVCTLEPCEKCAKALWDRGVKEVYFSDHTSKSGKNAASFTVWQQIKAMDSEGPTDSCNNGLGLFIGLLSGKATDKPEDKSDWATLFNDIRQYHKNFGYPKEFPRTEQSICVLQKQQIRTMVLALIDEVHEALHEVDWKPWKRYNERPEVNVEKFLEETGDILFFIDGMLMTFGLSWDDLMQAVAQKLKVVRDRMATGYHN